MMALATLQTIETCGVWCVLSLQTDHTDKTNKKTAQPIKAKPLFYLVAGVGFEPTTFRLWDSSGRLCGCLREFAQADFVRFFNYLVYFYP